MTEGKDQLPKPQEQEQHRCPKCGALARTTRTTTFLDPRKGKSVRVFECQCGERIWDD